MSRPNVSSEESMEGKVFVQYLAPDARIVDTLGYERGRTV